MIDRRAFGGFLSTGAAVFTGSAILPETSNALPTGAAPTGRPQKILDRSLQTYFKGKSPSTTARFFPKSWNLPTVP
jgi:hypothetical protein